MNLDENIRKKNNAAIEDIIKIEISNVLNIPKQTIIKIHKNEALFKKKH